MTTLLRYQAWTLQMQKQYGPILYGAPKPQPEVSR